MTTQNIEAIDPSSDTSRPLTRLDVDKLAAKNQQEKIDAWDKAHPNLKASQIRKRIPAAERTHDQADMAKLYANHANLKKRIAKQQQAQPETNVIQLPTPEEEEQASMDAFFEAHPDIAARAKATPAPIPEHPPEPTPLTLTPPETGDVDEVGGEVGGVDAGLDEVGAACDDVGEVGGDVVGDVGAEEDDDGDEEEIMPSKGIFFRVIDTPVKDVYPKTGVWVHERGRLSKDGNPLPDKCEWLCSKVIVAAYVKGEASGHGRLLKIYPEKGEPIEWNMSMRMTNDAKALRGALLDRGVSINMDCAPKLLPRYLSSVPDETFNLIDKPGWITPVGSAFMLPGHDLGAEKALLEDTSSNHLYRPGGTLEGWKAWVSPLLKGNPTLIFGLSASFTGPLLRMTTLTGGGFHFVGESSKGKTTILYLSSSTWGHWEDYKATWGASRQGVPAACLARNDTLLCLDELKQANSEYLSDDVYAIANGTEHQRNEKKESGKFGLAKSRSWKVMLLSTGEMTLEEKLKDGNRHARIDAGMMVRFVDIPISRKYGVFDNVDFLRGQAETVDPDNVDNIAGRKVQ